MSVALVPAEIGRGAFGKDDRPGGDRAEGVLEDIALDWLAADCVAKLLVDDSLHILWANPTALAWLEAGDCISMFSRRLSVGQSQIQLQEVIARAEERTERFCVQIDGAGAHVIICAKRVGHDGNSPTFGITARRTDRNAQSELFGVVEIFQLTQGELAVLKLLAAGRTAAGIAEVQRISVETVRTHIRRLYVKLDVSSREELFVRLQPFLIGD